MFSLAYFDNVASTRIWKIIKQGKIYQQIKKICEPETKAEIPSYRWNFKSVNRKIELCGISLYVNW